MELLSDILTQLTRDLDNKITSRGGGVKWKSQNPDLDNRLLASCPLGPVTANGVDLLTEIYVIYTKNDAPRSNGLGSTGVH